MKELLKSLAKFQSEIKPITKEASNPFYKSKYATLDHIQEHIKPVLINCGLVVIQRNVQTDSGLFVETKVVHIESGESEISVFPVIVNKQDAQSYGSAVSYAKRYSLSGLLNLTIQDEDDDGNTAAKPEKIGTKEGFAELKDDLKWLNVLDAEKNFTKEWNNILKAIAEKKITSIADVRKFYKVSKEVEAKITTALDAK